MRKRIFRIRNARDTILAESISMFQARSMAGVMEKTAKELYLSDPDNPKAFRVALNMSKQARRLRRKYGERS
jgi:hypothetical protein